MADIHNSNKNLQHKSVTSKTKFRDNKTGHYFSSFFPKLKVK